MNGATADSVRAGAPAPEIAAKVTNAQPIAPEATMRRGALQQNSATVGGVPGQRGQGGWVNNITVKIGEQELRELARDEASGVVEFAAR